jgi:hypothetical protein
MASILSDPFGVGLKPWFCIRNVLLRVVLRLIQSGETEKIVTSPAGPGNKNDCAGEGQ